MSSGRFRRHWDAVVLIAAGGILGANLRYGVGAVAGGSLATTVAVNAVGSFLLGLLLFDARADDILSKRLRYVFGTGFLASLTSYSTFVADIAAVTPTQAVLYITASYTTAFGGILASRTVVSTTATDAIRPKAPGED